MQFILTTANFLQGCSDREILGSFKLDILNSPTFPKHDGDDHAIFGVIHQWGIDGDKIATAPESPIFFIECCWIPAISDSDLHPSHHLGSTETIEALQADL